MIDITLRAPTPSTLACAIVILAMLAFGYGWSLVMERLTRRARHGWGRRALGSLVAGLLLVVAAFIYLTNRDGLAPADALVAFAVALAIAGAVCIGLSAIATVALPREKGAPWHALRGYTSSLLTWGFCTIFLAGGTALAGFAARLPG